MIVWLNVVRKAATHHSSLQKISLFFLVAEFPIVFRVCVTVHRKPNKSVQGKQGRKAQDETFISFFSIKDLKENLIMSIETS